MRFRIMTFGLAAVAVLVVTSVVGARPVTPLRGHSAASASAATAAAHPLDPLTADEILRTFTTIKSANNLAPATFLPVVKLSEPSKSFLQSWSPGQPFPRKSFPNVFDRNANRLYEAVVDLKTNTLESWTQEAGAQPAVFFTEYENADKLVRSYAPWNPSRRSLRASVFSCDREDACLVDLRQARRNDAIGGSREDGATRPRARRP